MDKFLNAIIDRHPQNTPELQIIFVPGTGASAGGLRRVKDADGIYELCTYTSPTNIAPDKLKKSDLIAVSMFFEASAVQRVIFPTEEGDIEVVRSGIIPARS